MTEARLAVLRQKATQRVTADFLTRDEVLELFIEIDQLLRHNQSLADELNDWRDRYRDLHEDSYQGTKG